MKVLCIADKIVGLTKGKWYQVFDEDVNLSKFKFIFDYLIIDDRGIKCLYTKSYFKTQREVREDKLRELGI